MIIPKNQTTYPTFRYRSPLCHDCRYRYDNSGYHDVSFYQDFEVRACKYYGQVYSKEQQFWLKEKKCVPREERDLCDGDQQLRYEGEGQYCCDKYVGMEKREFRERLIDHGGRQCMGWSRYPPLPQSRGGRQCVGTSLYPRPRSAPRQQLTPK